MYSTPMLVVIFLFVLIFIRGAWNAINKEWVSREATRELVTKAENFKSRESELERNIKELETEEGVREEIRAKFNVAEEGDNFIVLVDQPGIEESPATSTRPALEKWWSGLKNLFR